ncbi:MAG: VWA domain-containing protein [Sandaracinaceae bacterium]|nr:VWA domain-containing protein [Sandaracinaceae bacterium]
MRAVLVSWLLAGCAVSGGGGADASGPGADAGTTRTDAARELLDAEAPTCETTTARAEPLPATLLVNLDTSGSMNCLASAASCAVGDPTPAPDDSRYDVLRIELVRALGLLPDTTRVGVMHYPDTFSCSRDGLLVGIAPLASSRVAIEAALLGVAPEGITPTRDAVDNALRRLRAEDDARPRYQILATDGAATVCLGCDAACSFDALDRDNEALVADVERAATADDIRTFVIGVPGSASYRPILSRMASVAGTARAGCAVGGPAFCHYDLTDPALDFGGALRAALGAIGEAVLSCEYAIPPNPDGAFDPTKVNVRHTNDEGEVERIGRDPSRRDGWDYSDDLSRIELHGAACERVRATTRGQLEVLFGCPTELI